MEMKHTNVDLMYGIGGILLSINLLIYPVWVLIGVDTGVHFLLKRIFWICGSSFAIPLLIGLIMDPRMGVWLKICIGFFLLILVAVVVVLFPFSVRTYTFDVLTSFVSVAGVVLFFCSLYVIARRII